MKHENTSDIFGFETNIFLLRFDDDVRKVNSNDVIAVTLHFVELGPADGTTTTRLVGNDQVLTIQFLEKGLLVTCGDIRFSAGTKWYDIINRFTGIVLGTSS